jgi:uncharacterized LabA/DUF88 family protein
VFSIDQFSNKRREEMTKTKRQKILPLKIIWILGLVWNFHPGFRESDALINSHTICPRIRERYFSQGLTLFESSDGSSNEFSSNGDAKQLIDAQQKQIDKLMELLTTKASTSDKNAQQSASNGSQISLPPLKVMLFIDGTWLYYSLHTREDTRCPIQKKFGPGWQYKYSIDWDELPRIIGQALQQQDTKRGWMPASSENQQAQGRAVEVVRVHVYTSFRQDTPKTSLRYQMFQDMVKAKYDVSMLETMGHNEKCVDIQLAVDMLHFATVPDAYDVALLLSGDKDFIPAMVRTRQKGRRVGLVSMKAYSTRAFYDTPNIKDYDPIWLDDYLDQFIKPKANFPHLQGNRPRPDLSLYTIMQVISDFIKKSGAESISSRDIGRYIKSISIGDRCMLDEVKEIYGGLYQFLIVTRVFSVETSGPVRDYWVGLDKKIIDRELAKAKEETSLSNAENQFFQSYSVERLAKKKQKHYEFTLTGLGLLSDEDVNVPPQASPPNAGPSNTGPDYSQMIVSELKEVCREKCLKVSGKKADLLERILASEEMTEQQESPRSPTEDPATMYLEELLLEYLHASGGKASSRDVGRYLTANKPSPGLTTDDPTILSALSELKHLYGSLRQFIAQSNRFDQEEMEGGAKHEFLVRPTSTTSR